MPRASSLSEHSQLSEPSQTNRNARDCAEAELLCHQLYVRSAPREIALLVSYRHAVGLICGALYLALHVTMYMSIVVVLWERGMPCWHPVVGLCSLLDAHTWLLPSGFTASDWAGRGGGVTGIGYAGMPRSLAAQLRAHAAHQHC